MQSKGHYCKENRNVKICLANTSRLGRICALCCDAYVDILRIFVGCVD